MAIQQPISTDQLDTPDHSLSHRVFANDDSAPVKSVVVDASGHVTLMDGDVVLPFTAGTVALKKQVNRIYVSANGDYTTLKAAVDWFNASATSDTEILVDAGSHAIADTVTVNNASYYLQIRGLGSAVSYLVAATGLANKPMFNFKSSCDINKFTCVGGNTAMGGLSGYGVNAGEDCIVFDTTVSIYSEITDIFIDTFTIGVADLKGVDIFLFNFVISNCGTGVAVNYATTSIPDTTTDIEVGNFVNCAISIDLIKAETDNFIFNSVVFNNSAGQIAVKYNGTTFIYGYPAYMSDCSWNNIGTFTSGFDFTLARDANIVFIGNVGMEDKTPHAKINVVDNASATTITTGGVYYKAAFTNGFTYSCKIELNNNKMLFWPVNKKDGKIWLSGNLSCSNANRNATVCVRKEQAITSVTGNGSLVTVTTTGSHHLSNGQQVQMLNWTGGTGTWNGVKTITVTGATTFTYVNNGNGTATGGTCGVLISPMTVRTSGTAGVVAPFSIVAYLEEMTLNSFYEIYVTSTNNGDTITISDLNWLLDTR